jgi:hypothetical protein
MPFHILGTTFLNLISGAQILLFFPSIFAACFFAAQLPAQKHRSGITNFYFLKFDFRVFAPGVLGQLVVLVAAPCILTHRNFLNFEAQKPRF